MSIDRRLDVEGATDAATLERLRKVAELLPVGTSITLTRETLLEALKAAADVTTVPIDTTAAELAARFQRSTSTIRGWLEAGRFPGAYKLRGRDWRVPAEAIDAFREQERRRHASPDLDLSGWRKYMRRD